MIYRRITEMGNKFGRIALGLFAAASSIMGVFAIGAAPAAAQAEQARVRVIHASPDAPAVDVYVNDGKAITNLAYKGVSDTLSVPAGSYAVKVTATGATDAVISANLTLDAGKSYTVVAVGKLADITAKVFVDDSSALAAGKSRLRVIHASPDAPAVDIAVAGGPVLISNLAFPNASDNLNVDAATYNVEVRPAGTTTAALSAPNLSLESGKYYTVLAVGLLAGSPALELLPVVDTVAQTQSMPQPGMPDTGAGDNLFSLGVLGLILLATAALSVGFAVRVRNR
jgi:hypothetical protein